MKHASQDALDKIEPLLVAIRAHHRLKEKKRGIFYWKSSAFLHFHEDTDQVFADLRRQTDWERFPVNTPAEQQRLLEQVAIALSPSI